MEIRSAIMTTWTPMFDVNSSGPLLKTLGNGLDLPISGAWSVSSIPRASRPCSTWYACIDSWH